MTFIIIHKDCDYNTFTFCGVICVLHESMAAQAVTFLNTHFSIKCLNTTKLQALKSFSLSVDK